MRPFALQAEVANELKAMLPAVAERTVAAVTDEVADYSDAFSGEMGATIQSTVQMALAAFLRLATRPGDSAALGPAREGAYALGRGEARSGGTVDALLTAYRVGARVAWREMSAAAVEMGLPATMIAQFAELVFAYIDDLSAASVAGHTDELATSGRVRQQYRERLGLALLSDASSEELQRRAERAEWVPPKMLTAVLVPSSRTREVLALLDQRALSVPGDLVGLEETDVVLAPDSRTSLLRHLRTRSGVVGPSRPWESASVSFHRAVRALSMGIDDTEKELTSLVLSADPEALADLRAQALAPLADVREGTAERLAETLRSWLLHQGRREDVAAHLHVHPQTVRYRMTQIRELYGDQLTQPDAVLALVVGLALTDRK